MSFPRYSKCPMLSMTGRWRRGPSPSTAPLLPPLPLPSLIPLSPPSLLFLFFPSPPHPTFPSPSPPPPPPPSFPSFFLPPSHFLPLPPPLFRFLPFLFSFLLLLWPRVCPAVPQLVFPGLAPTRKVSAFPRWSDVQLRRAGRSPCMLRSPRSGMPNTRIAAMSSVSHDRPAPVRKQGSVKFTRRDRLTAGAGAPRAGRAYCPARRFRLRQPTHPHAPHRATSASNQHTTQHPSTTSTQPCQHQQPTPSTQRQHRDVHQGALPAGRRALRLSPRCPRSTLPLGVGEADDLHRRSPTCSSPHSCEGRGNQP